MGIEDKGSDPHLVHEVVAEKHLDYDSENQVPVHAEHTLKRQLKNRHIAMIRCAECPILVTRMR